MVTQRPVSIQSTSSPLYKFPSNPFIRSSLPLSNLPYHLTFTLFSQHSHGHLQQRFSFWFHHLRWVLHPLSFSPQFLIPPSELNRFGRHLVPVKHRYWQVRQEKHPTLSHPEMRILRIRSLHPPSWSLQNLRKHPCRFKSQ